MSADCSSLLWILQQQQQQQQPLKLFFHAHGQAQSVGERPILTAHVSRMQALIAAANNASAVLCIRTRRWKQIPGSHPWVVKILGRCGIIVGTGQQAAAAAATAAASYNSCNGSFGDQSCQASVTSTTS